MSDEGQELMGRALDREFDAKVAERVHGWTSIGSDKYFLFGKPPERERDTAIPCGAFSYHVPKYSTDAAADYKTLELVRQTWDDRGQLSFIVALNGILAERDDSEEGVAGLELLVRYYQVGDFSRAALATLESKDE